jgi:hypothetical protein
MACFGVPQAGHGGARRALARPGWLMRGIVHAVPLLFDHHFVLLTTATACGDRNAQVTG